MKWLLWKDYRLNRLIVFMAVFLVAVPHLTTILMKLIWFPPGHKIAQDLPLIAIFSGALSISVVYSLIISQIVFAFMGGNAIACERHDRAAEFLAYLPYSRAKILGSKLILSLLIAGFVWIVNLSILGIAWINLPSQIRTGIQTNIASGNIIANATELIVITGLAFFCIGWLFSSFLESPTFAISIGLITPMIVVMTINTIGSYFEFKDLGKTILHWYLYTNAVLAAASFIGGTWYYLRRVEP
jgi:ABC-type transport system involved in multi-copper enzyme maturation permease subunit